MTLLNPCKWRSAVFIAASDKVGYSTCASCKEQELLEAVSTEGRSVPSIVCLQFVV